MSAEYNRDWWISSSGLRISPAAADQLLICSTRGIGLSVFKSAGPAGSDSAYSCS